MYKKIADHISETLVSSGAIPGSETKVYSYAAELLLSSITGLVTCVGIGMLFSSPLGSLMFLAVYCPLRQFSGGYHAANHIACAVIFCLVFLANTLVAQYFIIGIPATPLAILILILTGISVVAICTFSPVEDKNKPLNQNEKHRFKKKSIILSIMTFMLVGLLLKLELLEASYFTCSAVLILSILLVMGKIKNLKGEKLKMKFMKSAPLMAALLMTLATASVNSASWWMIYQPEVPKELLKRK